MLNKRIRTTMENGDKLSDHFEWAREADIRMRAIEVNHDVLSTMEPGDSLTWEYQGYLFKTTVVEQRPPLEIG